MKIALILGGALKSNGSLFQYVKNRCEVAVSNKETYNYYFISSRYSLRRFLIRSSSSTMRI